MKKFKFKSFLLKKLISWLIIAAIVSVSLLLALYTTLYFSITSSFTVNTSEAVTALSLPNPVAREMMFNLYFDTEIYRDMGVDAAGILYNAETGEIVFDSEFNSFAVISASASETGEPVYLRNKSEEFLEKVAGWPTEHQGNLTFDIKNIYVDGENFYPGVVVFSETEGYEPTEIIGEPETVDYTPENAADYKEAVTSLGLASGTDKNSEALRDLRAGTTRDESIFDTRITRDISIGENKYTLDTLYYFDFYGQYADAFIIVPAITVLLAVGIAFLSAYSGYRKYSAQYQIDEYRRNMTNALAHDLKTPLTAIYGYTENLKNNIHTEKRDYYADAVLENVEYMNSIITSTLELAKLEDGSAGAKPENVNLTALSEELFEKYRPAAEEKGIKFTVSGKATTSADKKMISRAIENLISNAVKYTTENGTIEVIAEDKSISFINSCDKSLKGGTEELCRPFSKADESRSNRTGSGIGLSIVKNIVKLQGFTFEATANEGKFTARIGFKTK